MYVQVAVERKLQDYQDLLTYQVPEHLQPQIHWGSMVMVPMGRGNQPVSGYVTNRMETADSRWNAKKFWPFPSRRHC